METFNDVDVSLTVNLTANISQEVSEDYLANQPRNKRSRYSLDKGRKI